MPLSDSTRVSGPTLPANMNRQSTTLVIAVASVVTPVLTPTVPTAEASSKNTSMKLEPLPICENDTIMLADIIMRIPTINIHSDLCTSAGEILRLNTFTSECPLKNDLSVSASSATVVTFIPPAVPAGAPPINISIDDSSFDESVKDA